LRAREPIFSKSHTNEFCGIGKSTPEPAGPCRPLRPGRWVYEKGAGRAAAGLGTIKSIAAMVYWVVPRTPAAFCWSLASPWCSWRAFAFLRAREPIFSKTHTNEFCGIGKSTPQPAGPWDPLRPGRWVYEKGTDKLLWGGCRGTALAPLHGSLRRPLSVPFHTSPLSRGALRSAGVPTIAASTTPAPRLPWLSPGAARHLGRLCRRKGIPRVRRGVGYVGCWRFARPFQSHRGYLPVGDASGLNLPVGPPLGALRR